MRKEKRHERGATYRLCHVKDDDGSLGVAVVHRRQRSETFLPSRVPDLKLDDLVLWGVYGGDVSCCEGDLDQEERRGEKTDRGGTAA